MRWLSCLALVAFLCVVGACTTTQTASDKCLTFLIMPFAYSEDEAISDEVMRRWQKAVQSKMQRCDKFVEVSLNKETFQLINVDFASEMEVKALSSTQLEVLKEKTGATHVVGFLGEKKNNTFFIQSQLIDIDGSETEYEAFSEEVKITVATQKLNPSTFRWVSIKLAGAMPNALLIGTTNKELNNEREGEELFLSSRRSKNTTLVQTLSSIVLFTVPNSAEFGLLDVSTRWYPSLNLSVFNDEYTYFISDAQQRPVGDPIIYRVSAISVAGSVMGEAAVHTPLGATFVMGGLGIGVFHIADDFSEVFGLSGVLSIGLGHRAFLSESLFVSLSYQADYFEPSFIDNPYFKASSYSYVVLGVGYFFPGAKTVARQVID